MEVIRMKSPEGIASPQVTVEKLVNELQVAIVSGYAKAPVVFDKDGEGAELHGVGGGICGGSDGESFFILTPFPLDRVGGF